MQVNSLGLTEAQPENNVQRIVLEMLAVTLSKDARARAVQLPAWNEALGLPRPWDQQWSLRIQQVLAFESDLLEYGDLFDGSHVVESQDRPELIAGAEAEMAEVAEMGGMVPAVESGYLKAQLVASHAARRARLESGEDQVVGVNCFQATEPSPLTADTDAAVQHVDPADEARGAGRSGRVVRAARPRRAVLAALGRLRADAARPDVNLMDATLACARPGVTTGEWAFALREVFGEYRAPTGVGGAPCRLRQVSAPDRGPLGGARPPRARSGRAGCACCSASPGLDGHSNGVEQIAVPGPRRRVRGDLPGHPAHPRADRGGRGRRGRALRRAVDPVRRRTPSWCPRCCAGLRAAGLGDIPVVVGGIIPGERRPGPARAGASPPSSRPTDFGLTAIVGRIVDVIRRAHGSAAGLTRKRHGNRGEHRDYRATQSSGTGAVTQLRPAPIQPGRAGQRARASWRRPRACPPTRCSWTSRTPCAPLVKPRRARTSWPRSTTGGYERQDPRRPGQ